MSMSVGELAALASAEALALARAVLEQDIADREWASQVGPCLTQRDVARLLGKSEQAVSKDPRLVRLRNRDGRPVYPVCQFDGRRLLQGVGEVVRILSPAVEPLTLASWLTASNEGLDGRRPVDALREGEVDVVAAAARRFAERAVA